MHADPISWDRFHDPTKNGIEASHKERGLRCNIFAQKKSRVHVNGENALIMKTFYHTI
jgi:hypothetical protein